MRRILTIELCPFCKKNVIGLVGQDTWFEPFFLSVRESRDFFHNGICGAMHLKCLINSQYGRRLIEGQIEYPSVRAEYIIFKSDNEFIFIDPHFRLIHVWERPGFHCDFRFSDFNNAIIENDFLMVPTTSISYCQVTSPSLLGDICYSFNSGGSYRLYDFVKGMGVEAELLFPEGVVDGTMTPISRNEVYENNFIGFMATYNICITGSAAEFLKTWRPPEVIPEKKIRKPRNGRF